VRVGADGCMCGRQELMLGQSNRFASSVATMAKLAVGIGTRRLSISHSSRGGCGGCETSKTSTTHPGRRNLDLGADC